MYKAGSIRDNLTRIRGKKDKWTEDLNCCDTGEIS